MDDTGNKSETELLDINSEELINSITESFLFFVFGKENQADIINYSELPYYLTKLLDDSRILTPENGFSSEHINLLIYLAELTLSNAIDLHIAEVSNELQNAKFTSVLEATYLSEKDISNFSGVNETEDDFNINSELFLESYEGWLLDQPPSMLLSQKRYYAIENLVETDQGIQVEFKTDESYEHSVNLYPFFLIVYSINYLALHALNLSLKPHYNQLDLYTCETSKYIYLATTCIQEMLREISNSFLLKNKQKNKYDKSRQNDFKDILTKALTQFQNNYGHVPKPRQLFNYIANSNMTHLGEIVRSENRNGEKVLIYSDQYLNLINLKNRLYRLKQS